MIIAPFTKNEAIRLAAKHQNLLGKKYMEQHGIEHTILYVVIAPYEQRTKMQISVIFFAKLYNEAGYNSDVANSFVENYTGEEFDVVMVSVSDILHRTAGCLTPIQLLVSGDELDYGFNIKAI